MIIVRLTGGLGNQMFQYATARRIAVTRDVELKLDLSWYSNKDDTPRSYELSGFRIKESIASGNDIALFFQRTAAGRAWRRLQKFLRIRMRYALYMEHDMRFLPAILNAPMHAYLSGYWQSEKYFKDIRRILLEEFKPHGDLSGKDAELADRIRNCESVGVHVRRGDMASNPVVIKRHGLCPREYYLKAIERVAGCVKMPHVFVFSDDMSWARDNIPANYPITFVDHNGPVGGCRSDITLLRFCRHTIIANSSFSWWAAWLNENPGKIVIAPQRYYADEKRNETTLDLIPSAWIRL